MGRQMERRLAERTETNVLLTCRVPARPCRATMLDVSHLGCSLEMPDANIELGGTALLDLPGAGEISGLVVWVRGKRAGVRFHRRLTGKAAVVLGLEEPEPEPAAEPLAAAGDSNLREMLRHWIRRLTGGLS
jgi:hypothetical protein